MHIWQLQEAKARFSEVIKQTKQEPQIITLRGEETAAVIGMDAYREKFGTKQKLSDFLSHSPLAGVELEPPPDQPVSLGTVFVS